MYKVDDLKNLPVFSLEKLKAAWLFLRYFDFITKQNRCQVIKSLLNYQIFSDICHINNTLEKVKAKNLLC